MKTILSKICGQKNNFKSKATTEWGKTNEPVARQEYIKLKAKDHKNLVLLKHSYLLVVKIQFLGPHLMGLLAVSIMNQDF